jgi:methionyl aminopeptidase
MYKYSPIRALVGNGVGRDLHEEPQIPCFAIGKYEDSPEIKEGMTLAIEVMYSMGSPDVKLDSDGWTISTRDGKISALFEETIIVTKNRQKVLTAS